MVTVLALAWGALAAWPLVARARRVQLVATLPLAAPAPATGRRSHRLRSRICGGPVGSVVRGLAARRRAARAIERMTADLPPTLDLLQVAVGAGSSPHHALEITARWAPARVRAALRGVLDAVALGDGLADALARLGRAEPVLAPLADVLIASDSLGSPAGPALARLAEEVRADLRRRADARARVLPVKLLFPLVFLVLPAFGLLTVVPALLSAVAHL
jgi:tight adherence protein C